MVRIPVFILILAALAACSGKPIVPYTIDGPPLALVPATTAGINDQRGRFREIACALLEEKGREQPGYRECEDALTRVGREPEGTGEPVYLGPSRRELTAAMVPGIGWECFRHWLKYEQNFGTEVRNFGYSSYVFHVDGLSGTTNNARQIRDKIMENTHLLHDHQLVMIGYSKGAPDILEAVVSYPEIHPYIAAVVSVAGAVGGSALAYTASESQLDLMRHVPESTCSKGDDEGLLSLRPDVRRAWLADNPLPQEIPYYSVVTLPLEGQISSVLKSAYNKLARIDPRNDSQVIFYDQVIPGSTLVGYLNADHWAVAVPVSEAHPFIGKTFVDKNAYPWRAMLESVVRFVEEDLDRREAAGNP